MGEVMKRMISRAEDSDAFFNWPGHEENPDWALKARATQFLAEEGHTLNHQWTEEELCEDYRSRV